MRTSAASVHTSISTSSQKRLMWPETVQGPVLHVERDNTNTFAILHDQIEGKVLDEEVGVMVEY